MDGRALPRAARGFPLAGALAFAVAVAFGGLAQAQTTSKPRLAGPALPSAVVTTRAASFRVVTTKASKKKVTTTTKKKVTKKATKSTVAPVDTQALVVDPPAVTSSIPAPPPAISYSSPVVFVPGAGNVLELGPAEVSQLVAGGRADVDIRGTAGLAASGKGSVVLDVTIASPTAAGTVTVSPLVPDDQLPIQNSVITYVAGPTHVARIAISIGSQGSVHVEMSGGSQGLSFAVVGWVDKGTGAPNNDGGTLLTPCRLIDTATNVGGIQGPVATPFDLPAVGVAQVPAPGGTGTQPVAVLYSVLASNAAAAGSSVSLVQTGQKTPLLSVAVNPGAASNGLFAMPLGPTNRLAVYPSGGTMNVAIDAVGWIDKDGQGHTGGPCP